MQDINKSKDQLIAELETTRWEMAEMRQRLTELESLAVTHEQMKEALKESDARLARDFERNRLAAVVNLKISPR